MFDVLVYLYETYWRPDACPDPAQLQRKLTAMGFERDDIQDALTWLDGLSICLYLGAGSLLLGGGLHLLLTGAARLAGQGAVFARQVALCLLPTGAAGLLLGLSATTVKLLRYEGLALLWVPNVRGALLSVAILWSLHLGWQVCSALRPAQRLPVLSALVLANLLIATAWWLQFWGW